MELAKTGHVGEFADGMSETTRAKFEALLQQYGGIIRKVAFGYARNENDRRDLTQDILLQFWKAFPRYSPERPFSTWMYRISLNVAISFLRKNTRPGRETVPFEESQHDVANEQPISPHTHDRITMLGEVIAKYPALDRALLLLYLDDRSYREIAAILGLTETNVATKLTRLKERLRQELTK